MLSAGITTRTLKKGKNPLIPFCNPYRNGQDKCNSFFKKKEKK